MKISSINPELTPQSPNLSDAVTEKPADTPLLDSLSDPQALRSLSRSDLVALCAELRRDLIARVNQVGGHFASSLGVTELTVALHTAFETPHDRIVWDVGHQAYIHKILTGRREQMSSVRQLGGISGFPRRVESEFDTFGVAHAGTSISAAAGMLEAAHHDYPGSESRRVVAVIGDGAMTAGMAFEALNHAGQLHRQLIVVLNDNEMSIAPNVGALSWMFSKTLTGRISTTARRHFKSLVERGVIPHSFYRALDRAEEAAQGFFSTPAMLFESFGFRYIGPVDGHNMDQLLDALERAKEQDSPVLIHALTVKGKGYEPAEADPVKYHAVNAFSLIEDGKPVIPRRTSQKPPTYTKVFGDTMVELCRKDPRLVGITAAMPDGTGLTRLAEEMPDRFFDVGIAEQHAVTFAAGLACEGMRPVCAIYSTFLQRAYDQIVHDVCIQSLPVIFAMDRGGVVGADGPTHHGVFDISYLRCLPNMVVMAPKDEAELRDMMLTAVEYLDGPIAYRYPRGEGTGTDIERAPQRLEIGKAELLKDARSSGSTVLLVGLGQTVAPCIQAAQTLAAQGIEASVVNARFVKPLDEALFTELIESHSLIVTVEDHARQGGFGSALLEFMADRALTSNRAIIRLGIDDFFVEHGTQAELHSLCEYDAPAIVARVQRALGTERHQSRPIAVNL
ncbi:MAG: 1-deoxy-D-xylulose-5-phosphate synthase [Bdellovibrionales bacterium]|nr:1-deoxy-D-xylulose-5-phosphate synthase [Bdellovibrionales bacterium]